MNPPDKSISGEIPEAEANNIASVIGAPDFIIPWLDRFYEPMEFRLLSFLAEGPRAFEEMIGRIEAEGNCPAPNIATLLNRASGRAVVSLMEDGRFEAASFHQRFEIWALFEGWKDLPADVRGRLNDWELSDYEAGHTGQIADLKAKKPLDPGKAWPRYLLLHEAETVIRRAGNIYLWPCNCRAMMGKCRKSIYTCLRFSNNLELGWEISRERALEIVREANKSGLMQSGELKVTPKGELDGAICNCCPDCCFPHLLTEKQNANKLWPLSRYIARRIEDKCTLCGICAKKCPFGAFRLEKNGAKNANVKKQKVIRFDPEKCRGCGVCAENCPEDAIEMDPLDGLPEDSLLEEILQVT